MSAPLQTIVRDSGFEIVLDGDESRILAGLDRALADIEPVV